MENLIALATEPSRLALLLVGHSQGGCSLLAPSHPGASVAIIGHVIHSRALSPVSRAKLLRGKT